VDYDLEKESTFASAFDQSDYKKRLKSNLEFFTASYYDCRRVKNGEVFRRKFRRHTAAMIDVPFRDID